MKKFYLLLLCFTAATAFTQEIQIDRDLTHWKKSGKNVSSEVGSLSAGKYSLRVGSNSEAVCKVQLEKDSLYTVSFRIRGKDIPSEVLKSGKKTAGYLIIRGNRRAKLLGKFETGSFDWKKVESEFSVQQLGTTDAALALVMRGRGTVWLEDVKFTKSTPKYFQHFYTKDIKEIALFPGGVFGFFDPGQKVKFNLQLSPWPKGVQFKCRIKDEYGKVVYVQKMRTAAGEITFPGQKAGYYVADFEFYLKNKKILYYQSAFAVNKPIARRDPFFAIGFGAHDEALEGFKRIGAGMINLKVKVDIPGRSISLERMLNMNMGRWGHRKFIESGDFEISAVFSGSVVQKNNPSKEKIKAGFPVSTDAYWNRFAAMVEAYVKENKGKIAHYVIQSEIPSQAGHKERNCGTFTEAMFNHMISTRIASRIIRRIDPKAVIWFGGNNRAEYQNTTERIVAEDLGKEIDGLVIDAYTGNWYLRPGAGYRMPEEKMLDFLKSASEMSLRLGLPQGKAIRNEELGYAMQYGEPYDGKYAVLLAALTARSLILNKTSDAVMMEIHKPYSASSTIQLRKLKNEDRYMSTVWRACWFKGKGGRTQLVPLPGGAMYAALASELAFAVFKEKVTDENFYSCIFARPDGKTVLTLWNIQNRQDFVIDLPVNARLVNMYGRETLLRAGKNVIRISPEPCYLILSSDAGKSAALIRSAISENMPEAVCKAYFAAKDRIKVYLRNQTGRALRGKLVFPRMKDKNILVQPKKVASFLLDVRSGGKFISASGRVYPIELAQSSFHSVQKVSGKVVFDGTGKWLKGLKSGLLKYPEAIRPADALQEERCYFKTPRNPNGHSVSARYWTAYDQKNFYLAVEVDDPVHLQRYEKNLLWRDDCVQFSFTADDFIPLEFRSMKNWRKKSEFNYCAALTKKGLQFYKFFGKNAGLINYPFNVTRRNNKTLYEIAVPFREFGGKRPVRFGFVVFDNNYPALDSAPYWLEFSPGVASGKDSSHLKLLIWE